MRPSNMRGLETKDTIRCSAQLAPRGENPNDHYTVVFAEKCLRLIHNMGRFCEGFLTKFRNKTREKRLLYQLKITLLIPKKFGNCLKTPQQNLV